MLSDDVWQAIRARPNLKAKERGGRLYFCCLRHEDKTASAWTAGGAHGCFACGFEESITTLAPELGVTLTGDGGYTLERYADEKGFSVDTLRGYGLTTAESQHGRPVVRIPFFDEDGNELRARFRSTTGKWWEGRNQPIHLYGRDRLVDAKPGDGVLVVEGECLTADAEMFTADGWVRIDEYEGGEIAQWNSDGSLEMVEPLKFYRGPWNGPMMRWINRNRFFAQVTPNHKMVSWDYRGRVRTCRAADAPVSQADNVPRVGVIDGPGSGQKLDALRLMLAVSADGSFRERKEGTRYIHFGLQKDRKWKRLRDILGRLGISHTCNPRHGGGRYISFRLPTELGWIDRTLPWGLLVAMSEKERRAVLEEVPHWDGNGVPNRNQHEFNSTLKHNAEWVQALCHTTGECSTIMERSGPALGEANSFDWYKVSMLHGKTHESWQSLRRHHEVVRYDGIVGCPTVPSGMFLVRQRGCVFVTGNSDCHALWSVGIMAVGVPGATSWKPEWAEYLNGLKVYVWEEPDQGGAALVKSLVESFPDAKIVHCEGAKDPCDLRLREGEGFRDRVMDLLREARPHNATEPPVPFDLLGPARFERLLEDQLTPIDAVPTPFPAWNTVCRDEGGGTGLARGWHVLAAARTGTGKSILALNVAAKAMRAGETVCFLSLEMSQRQVETRLMAIVSGVPVSELEKGAGFSAESFRRAALAFELPGRFVTNRAPIHGIGDVVRSIQAMHEIHGCRFFVVDYLQLAGNPNDPESITEVSYAVRKQAKDLSVITFGLSQFNRATSVLNETPTVNGLMGGSALENDADQVVLIDHSKVEPTFVAARRAGWTTNLVLAKSRHGPTGVIPIGFNSKTLRMAELLPDEIPASLTNGTHP